MLRAEDERPIFIVGLARSGTGMLLNLLQSHPEVCTVGGEVHEVFDPGRRPREPLLSSLRRRGGALQIRLLQGEDPFRNHWHPRRPLRPASIRLMNAAFRRGMRNARGVTENRNKADGVRYADHEIEGARFVTKLLQGLLLLTEPMMSAYPQARFVGIVRHGLALCEGHIRRGIDPQVAAAAWRDACDQMIRYADRHESFRLFRFEELIGDPLATFDAISRHAGLDPDRIDSIRWVSKKTIDARGTHSGTDGTAEQRLEWFPKHELPLHVVDAVNDNQIGRLSERERDTILGVAGDTLRRLSYAGT